MQENNKIEFCCKWAESLGSLENTHQEVWGTKDYVYDEDKERPTVFMGLYDLRDYIALMRHKGTKYILWCGSDIVNLTNGFVFNDGKLKWLSKIFKGMPRLLYFLREGIEHYVENQKEQEMLKELGIDSHVVPSFLGKFEDFPVCYKQADRPNVFVSGHSNRQNEYGFDFIERITGITPKVNFHLYGADWDTDKKNIICHGRVSKEQFNQEIREYQAGLRMNEYDGFSEITAKSLLMGQYPITKLKYEMIPNYETEDELVALLNSLSGMNEPNTATREFYIIKFNNYPWNVKYGFNNNSLQK